MITNAQDSLHSNKIDRRALMKDTLDGKLDFSRFLIDAKGFVPIPIIITEPAVGGFGGMIIPTFITQKKVAGFKQYVPPDITAAMGMYTANNSWAVGALRAGSFPKLGLKYRLYAGYVNLNLDYYRTLPVVGEKSFEFNRKMIPISVSISKKVIKDTEFYLGVMYAFTPTKLKPTFSGSLPAFVKPIDLDNHSATLGLFGEIDKRNTIFTPDKGIRAHVEYLMNADWTGSDFTFQRLNAQFNWFTPIKSNWISGIRTEFQQVYNDPPFYMLPSIDMRGVPKARYQGQTTALVETEQRFDLNLRWSILGFGGLGKAIEKKQSFSDAATIYNMGVGFRYLLARAFKLRVGIDVAKGPDNFGWYLVFGHNWNR